MKYRKKPVVIDAVKWTGENLEEIQSFVGGDKKLCVYELLRNDLSTYENLLVINKSPGDIIAYTGEGDYIIKNEKGELYTRNHDIFEQNFEPAE